ncbi:MAG TPA: ATP-binding cassette domain-containing protein [Trebonia sp.]|jgi:ABC-type branched-subunit amino acid transport system ATPase component|nr:ATP-binding cassette domain-containing protein [Trebonia sp.]
MPGPSEAAVLACADVTKIYGGLRAVDGVSLEVPGHGLYGLCGFNGAGKSTLFSLLAGSARADAGSVRIGGQDVTRWPATRRARSGVARTWQTVRLAPGRTTLDNVAAACLGEPGQSILGSLWRPLLAPARERARDALERLGIGHLAGHLVDGLTLESQRLTELARALVTDPKVLLADEPASGLSATQRTVLAEVLATISAERAVVVVEHDLDMLTSISEHMWAMVEGRLAYSGDVAAFRSSRIFAELRGIQQNTLRR